MYGTFPRKNRGGGLKSCWAAPEPCTNFRFARSALPATKKRGGGFWRAPTWCSLFGMAIRNREWVGPAQSLRLRAQKVCPSSGSTRATAYPARSSLLRSAALRAASRSKGFERLLDCLACRFGDGSASSFRALSIPQERTRDLRTYVWYSPNPFAAGMMPTYSHEKLSTFSAAASAAKSALA